MLGEDSRGSSRSSSPKGELDSQYREIYQNFIKSYLPSLKEMVDAVRPVGPAGGVAGNRRPAPAVRRLGGFRPGMGMPPGGFGGAMPGAPGQDPHLEGEWTGIVEWNEADYTEAGEPFQVGRRPLHLGRCPGPGRPLGVRGGAAGDQADQRRGQKPEQCRREADRQPRHRRPGGTGLAAAVAALGLGAAAGGEPGGPGSPGAMARWDAPGPACRPADARPGMPGGMPPGPGCLPGGMPGTPRGNARRDARPGNGRCRADRLPG